MARLSTLALGSEVVAVLGGLLVPEGIDGFCMPGHIAVRLLITSLVIVLSLPVLWRRRRVLTPLVGLMVHGHVLEVGPLDAEAASILDSRVNINSSGPRH